VGGTAVGALVGLSAAVGGACVGAGVAAGAHAAIIAASARIIKTNIIDLRISFFSSYKIDCERSQ
jgi:hypothetical protein